MKKIVGAIIGCGMVFAAVVPSFAQTPSSGCINDTTGAESKNYCVGIGAKLALFKVNNKGAVLQFTNTRGNTGGNIVDKNTVAGGGVSTGAASATTLKEATLNDNVIDVTQSGSSGSMMLGNSTTGYKSTNVSVGVDIKAAVFKVDNNGFVLQKTTTTANSGDNSASMNTTGGSVTTGNATAQTGVSASVNTNKITITQ